MTLEKAIKILELNVPFSRSPEASQIKEAIEIVKFALGQKKIEIHLEESFLKECECEIENAKEQAVREFAERLNAKFENFAREDCYGTKYFIVGEGVVNRVVNEMFGKPEQQEGENNAEIKHC